jgi:phage terminase large subunit-like protein
MSRLDASEYSDLGPMDREMYESVVAWLETARRNQLTPEYAVVKGAKVPWRIWMLCAGRGFGKTRTAAEDMKRYAWMNDGARLGVIAATFGDGRDICFEGESGLLAKIPSSCIEIWNRSIGELKLRNGSMFKLFSADEPDRMRGFQFHRAWADELATYKGKVSQKDAAAEGVPGTPRPMLAQIELATRLKPRPQILITTTPRPLKILKEVKARPTTVFTSGSTWENKDNLAGEFLDSMTNLYEGTRLGRQELYAEILEDVDGALWTGRLIDDMRLDPKKDQLPQFKRIVVAVDPAVTANKRSSETGIMVVGLTYTGRGVVLEDASGKYSPEQWAEKVTAVYSRWKADRVVAEKNNGGDMVQTVLRSRADSKNLPVKLVDATKGKIVRAEPVAGLYEQKKVSHWGVFPQLEEQMTTFTGEDGEESPDRLDALVWGLTELMLSGVVVPHVAVPASPSIHYWGNSPGDGENEFGISADSDPITMSY